MKIYGQVNGRRHDAAQPEPKPEPTDDGKRRCRICGASIEGTHRNTLYCSDECRKKMRVVYSRRHRAKYAWRTA